MIIRLWFNLCWGRGGIVAEQAHRFTKMSTIFEMLVATSHSNMVCATLGNGTLIISSV